MRSAWSRAVCGALVCLAVAPAAATAGSQEAAPAYERLSNERGRTYWSTVLQRVSVRARPTRKARAVAALRRFTYYGQTEVVVAMAVSGSWTRVRYSGTGRRTGWVPTSALSVPQLTRTWVVIDKRRRLLRAYRGKRRLLQARVGIGARGSPTPGGRFFIRERLVPADKGGIYGVLALGLSAYSRHRTDWPGGGQVGIHGTNQPGLIPGRISNGCVRMRNRDVRRLGRIVRRGTPVRIR